MGSWSDLKAAVITNTNMAWVTTREKPGPLNSELWRVCKQTGRVLLWYNKAYGLQALDQQTLGWTPLMPGGDNLGQVFEYLARKFNLPFVLNMENPQLWPLERDAVMGLRMLSVQLANTQKTVLLTVPKGTQVPAGLDGIVLRFDHPVPDKDELAIVIEGVLEDNPSLESEEVRTNWIGPMCQTLRGLTAGLAEDCLLQSLELARSKFKKSNPGAFWEAVLKNMKTWKESQVTSNGRLVLLKPATHPLVGWDAFLTEVKRLQQIGAFNRHPTRPELPHPLAADAFAITGMPGGGKSESAKAVAALLKLPAYLIDGAKLKGGGYVGDMERSFAAVLADAEALGPCVVLFDEFSKAIGGAESSRQTSAGALEASTGILLTWLQENAKAAGVVMIASMNDTNIPPEMLRGGRIQVWSAGLPETKVRASAAKVFMDMNIRLLAEFGQTVRPASDVSSEWVGSRTVGYMPAEIEAVVKKACVTALARQPQQAMLTQDDFEHALSVTAPMTRTQPDRVRAILATASRYPSVSVGRVEEVARPAPAPLDIRPVPEQQSTAAAVSQRPRARQRTGG